MNKQHDPKVTEFREKYFNYVDKNAPDLRLEPFQSQKKKKEGITWFPRSNANEWIYFYRALDLDPAQAIFKLIMKPDGGKKDPQGRASLEVKVLNKKYEKLKPEIMCMLESGMQLGRAKESFTVDIRFPVLDAMKPLDEQEDRIDESIASLRRLQSWFNCHKEELLLLLNDDQFVA